MKKIFLLTLVLFLISNVVLSQKNGFLRGNIADGQFGGPLVGATVLVKEISGKGTTTDFDGNFSLSLPPGAYTIQISFISFKTLIFENVEIKSEEVKILDAILKTASQELNMVEIVEEVRRNSEVAVLMERKNASIVTDGISSQAFRKVGDSELSGAMKRVTGITIQDGKYVYVRGLGDRYTITTLNGMIIPGLDPDVNSVQLDIFPTGVLENVAVYKTFSPDLYGDLTGGQVNIITKKFPSQKSNELSVGLTYIPGMTFNEDYILYNRGSMDWLGFDDGSRELPINPRTIIPDEVELNPELERVTRAFNPQLGVKSKTALPNGSFSFFHGNQKNTEKGATIGYNAVFNYTNEHLYYSDFQSNDYLKSTEKEENELVPLKVRQGVVGINNVMWSGLLSGSYKKNNNSYTLTYLSSQSGESSASRRTNEDLNQNVSLLVEDVLTYTARSLNTAMLNGSHRIRNMNLSWANATSFSRVNDPDFRETRISVTDGDTTLSTGNGAGIDRFWRNLNEITENLKVDLEIPLLEKVKIKTGASALVKFRDFEVFNYKHRRNNLSDIELDPDWFLNENNYWSSDPNNNNFRNGTYTLGNFQPSNSFSARQNIFGGYVLAQHPIKDVFKLSYGVRVEKTDMFYTGQKQIASEGVYNDEKTMDEFNILPSFNMVYNINDKMNLRLAANQTVARPSFKEKSIAQIYDPIVKRTFIGNIDLEQTNINNFDLRYEYFLSAKELFSVSGFYKQFDGHIELVSFAVAPDNFTPKNSGDAQLFGAEFEARKSLGKKDETKFINRFFVAANFTLVRSFVDLKSVIVNSNDFTEYDLRETNLRDGETLGRYRAMAGQSPYTINFNLSYEIPDKETSVSIAYNIQGEQLTVIASGRVPDVYTVPFNSLNFNAYRSFGKDNNSKITIGVSNILNDDRTLIYKSYMAEDKIYTSFKPGVGISCKYSLNF